MVNAERRKNGTRNTKKIVTTRLLFDEAEQVNALVSQVTITGRTLRTPARVIGIYRQPEAVAGRDIPHRLL